MLRPKDLCQGSGTKTFLDAMHGGKVHLARFVLDALDGRIINSKTENSRTPLMFAVSLPEAGPRLKFMRLLLEKGADVNCQDEHGRTPLSLACELGHLDSVKLLVQFNADPEISDVWGNNALMYAAYAGHSQVLEFLVRAFKRLGLQLDQTNRAGQSAIQVADFYGHNLCVEALNIPWKRCSGLDNSLVDAYLGRDVGGDQRRPNRLSKQVLEKFTQQFHSKCEDHLPAVFQRQLRVGEGGGIRRRQKGPNQSPDGNGQHQFNHSQKLFSMDDQDTVFTARQIQNSKQWDKRGGAKTQEQHPLSCQEDGNKAKENKQRAQETGPVLGKAKSFNLDHLTRRKQSYQDDMSDASHSTVRIKRGSLQDDQALMRKNQEDTEFKKRSSPPQNGRQDKILYHREEMAPGRIPLRPPGFTGLGTRLLRRFTAPEFLRLVKDFPSDSEHGRGKISRSETFPLTSTHLKVNSQPSVDSISGVTCEFESNGARRLALV